MDTRFWGPSGWRLLHLITFTYEPEKQKAAVREMFSMLPFVLPCKYCRASFSQYLRKEPLEPALHSRAKLTRWLWKIHNLVNGKLRGQGLLKEADPSFADVKKVYEERVAAGCIRTEFEGWNFLFSIAENHPFSQGARASTPMPDAPAVADTPELRNEYNLMKPEERIVYYERFWKSLAGALPFQEWRDAWTACAIRWDTLEKRYEWMRELWKVRCCMEKELQLINHEEFGSLCKRLINHRSGCGTKKRGKTCRRITRKKK